MVHKIGYCWGVAQETVESKGYSWYSGFDPSFRWSSGRDCVWMGRSGLSSEGRLQKSPQFAVGSVKPTVTYFAIAGGNSSVKELTLLGTR